MSAIDAQTWINLLLAVLSGGAALTAFFRKPGESALQAVAQLKERITEQDRINAMVAAEITARNVLIEERVKNLPTHGDINRLIQSLSEMKGDLSAVRQGQTQQQTALTLIQEFLNRTR